MSGRIQYEVWLMALSLVTGAWLMLAYDTLRVFRLVIRHGSFWMGVEAVSYTHLDVYKRQQVLRLEYYELFSRFYRGSGRAFEPYGKAAGEQ